MKTEGLDDAFNVETSIVPAEVEKVQKKEKSNADHIGKDYEYTRGNLYSIIEKGQEAINGILELAQESEMQVSCIARVDEKAEPESSIAAM